MIKPGTSYFFQTFYFYFGKDHSLELWPIVIMFDEI